MSFPKPWVKFYHDSVPESINYPETTLYGRLVQSVEQYSDLVAWEFLGKSATYREFLDEIDLFANALYEIGLRKGDVITISMPTSPNGIIPIYAVNKLGAISSLIHPLSPPEQIKNYLQMSNSKFALTLDAFYQNFEKILGETKVEKMIVCRIPDYLGKLKGFGFWATKGRKFAKIPQKDNIYWYKDLLMSNAPNVPEESQSTHDCAVIMYSGGTTGTSKGIMLSNMNLISEGMQAAYWGYLKPKEKMLAILPIFHGFGLGVCVNAVFMLGGTSILVPTFTPETVAVLVKKSRPNFLIGVPTLFEALVENPDFRKTDLSCLKVCFSGADTLPRKTKERFEEVVQQAGGSVKLLEGYGLTEAVTAIMATPYTEYREGSIGIPWPDMLAKVSKPGETVEVPIGQEGELCLHGPAVMLGYLDDPEETANVLKKHEDGRTWLHTGDLVYQDADGFFYFRSRIKRLIKVSGYNCYPRRVEDVIQEHPKVRAVCVVGIPHRKQISMIKAFVVPEEGVSATDELAEEIKQHCLSKLLQWEAPREIEFRQSLPLTLVNKVDYKQLEREELERLEKNVPADPAVGS